MALTVDWTNKIVTSDASITDLPAHHLELRDLEATPTGMLHDDICSWQNLSLGSGAFLPQIDYINGYSLRFAGQGPFDISGNLNAPIIPTGVQVNIKTSAAYVTTSVGGSGPSVEDIAAACTAALLAAAQITPIHADIKKMNSAEVIGDGSIAEPWRGVGVVP